ncbi:ribosome biogenesis factor YjgA [Haemophilus influenzae]|uniref:ribosome biogenesis factor YjgA n=1 Tax=Haemophilus influenzae TaxID=727 RepID=UPI000DD3453E|nr:ribosome biogenesis factor YjgA [Haemophilus influenzae]
MAKRKKKEVFDWEDEDQEEIIWVSKSEIKRDAEDLKQLGEKIVNLTKNNLARIPLNESLLDAIELAQRLQKEARRRQLQYIGKLLRGIDVEPIREVLDKIENKHNQQQAILHKIEKVRDELVEKGDVALTDLLNDYPDGDRQQLRNLIRSAQKELEQNKPSKAYREIYQMLKVLMLED